MRELALYKNSIIIIIIIKKTSGWFDLSPVSSIRQKVRMLSRHIIL